MYLCILKIRVDNQEHALMYFENLCRQPGEMYLCILKICVDNQEHLLMYFENPCRQPGAWVLINEFINDRKTMVVNLKHRK